MRIKRIEIASFGKFKNFSMHFSDGFNLIFGKNEDGKSTVMAFISLMLYGTAGTASRSDLTQNIRKKYLPWSGEQMAGDMEIECGGKTYLIHKEFRASAKTDKVSVTDVETGGKLSLPPDMEVGKYFLGIDYGGFEKSIFGGSAQSFAGAENGDISARLSNLSESGDESVSPKIVIGRIETAKDELIKKRSKGRLTLAEEKAEELFAQIEAAKTAEEHRKKLKEEYNRIDEELMTLLGQAEQNRLALKSEEKRTRVKQLKKLAALYNEISENENALLKRLNGDDKDEVLSRGQALKNAVLLAEEKLSGMEKVDAENFVSEEDMKEYFILREQKQLAEAENIALCEKWENKKKKTLAVLTGTAALGIIIFAIGLIGGFFAYPMFSLAGLGGIVAIASFVSSYKIKSRKAETGAEEKLAGICEKLQSLFNKRNCQTAQEFEAAYREGIAAAEKQRLRVGAENSLKDATAEFIGFMKKYGEVLSRNDGINILENLEKEVKKLKIAEQTADSYAKACGIEKQDGEKLLSLAESLEKELPPEAVSGIDTEEIEKEIRAKNNKLLEIKGLLGTEPRDIGVLERELAQAREEIGEMRAYYESLCLAAEVLSEAEDEMRRSFAPRLRERASEILSALTGGRYKNLSTDKSYDIEVKSEETVGYKKWHYLSRGTCAQSYLALRIAVCELLSDEEAIPLLLDDVLSDYDDERGKLASNFLEEYAKNGRQVLFFTCHNWKGEAKNKKFFS